MFKLFRVVKLTLLILSLIFFSACVRSVSPPEQKAAPAAAAAAPVTNNAPVAVSITPGNFNEDTQSLITLSYSDANSDMAVSCSLSSLSHVSITQACDCAAGVCVVGVSGEANYNGAAGFSYTVTANGQISNLATASFLLLAVNDAPVTTNITPVSFNEDTQSIITLSYSDADSDQATVCTPSALSNVTVTQACACAGGTCTIGVTGTPNYNGAAGFSYTVTANGQTSNISAATFTINNVNDAPVATNISPASFNEDVQSIITLSYSDADSDQATVCTPSALSNVTVTQACACAGGTCTVGVTGTPNYNGAAGFSYTVTANGQTSNVATATLTINSVIDLPGAFTIGSATAGDTQAVLTWAASAGATSYTVKYGTSTGSYPTSFSTTATSPTTVTGLTNGSTYYFMVVAVNGEGSTNATSELTATPVAETGCPTNYILVPANPAVGTNSDFCVAKYNMKAVDANGALLNGGNGQGYPVWTANACWVDQGSYCDNGYYSDSQVDCELNEYTWIFVGYYQACNVTTRYSAAGVEVYPGSLPGGTPWVSINQTEAKNACTGLGAKYDLISNPEWMTIARNSEDVASNWSSGAVGTGIMARGHSDGPALALAVTNPADPYDGTGNNSGQAAGSGWEQRRTLTLSNGNVIWDFSGNVWQLVDWSMAIGLQSGPVTCSSTWVELPSVACGALATTSYQPSHAAYDSSKGMGRFSGGAGGGALRGGNSSSGVYAGAFTLLLGNAPTTAGTYIGFRCVYRP